ncbi:MAG: cupin domain-containing protein [Brevundimonas sp.]|uniref:cupin domain-containing protein n=1 Tax=Brevundimonas sp. TaxID=1871086 RepID=UPI00273543F6|nr:cupin domain-containing protein [Brevundimonas sp.]MDP3655588.1 cupin domain-containing protein [Brevundimonas sp.]MDZ4110651.1 cupin domain-containing protein [Brevundimonas sp.]
MELIELIPAFSDNRGDIIDLISDDTINAVTVITFAAGAVRANHYHERTIQWNYIMSGEVQMVTQSPGGERQERVLRKGDFAMSVEHERHALKALTDAEVLILTKGPRAGSEYENDTFRLTEPLINPGI